SLPSMYSRRPVTSGHVEGFATSKPCGVGSVSGNRTAMRGTTVTSEYGFDAAIGKSIALARIRPPAAETVTHVSAWRSDAMRWLRRAFSGDCRGLGRRIQIPREHRLEVHDVTEALRAIEGERGTCEHEDVGRDAWNERCEIRDGPLLDQLHDLSNAV